MGAKQSNKWSKNIDTINVRNVWSTLVRISFEIFTTVEREPRSCSGGRLINSWQISILRRYVPYPGSSLTPSRLHYHHFYIIRTSNLFLLLWLHSAVDVHKLLLLPPPLHILIISYSCSSLRDNGYIQARHHLAQDKVPHCLQVLQQSPIGECSFSEFEARIPPIDVDSN